MESTSPHVPLPQIKAWIDYEYRPCTIPYRFPSDPPQATHTENLWINLFRNSIATFQKVAAADEYVTDAPARAAKFGTRYGKMLDELQADPKSHGGPPDVFLLCRLREICLREVGFTDIYKKIKDDENAKALLLLESVVATADEIQDAGQRIEHLVKGVLAGNIFDLGSAVLAERFAAKGGASFKESVSELLPRPWVIDDLDAFRDKWVRKPWKKAVIFVDNAGTDVILGIIPFARELLRRGTKVILSANELPAINDITHDELRDIISKVKKVENGKETIFGVDAQHLLVISSGNDLPVIDLSSVSEELAYATEDADLVIVEGMGRGIETNLYAQFKCDSAKIGMVKHPEVAEFLGGRLFDCVIKFTEVIR